MLARDGGRHILRLGSCGGPVTLAVYLAGTGLTALTPKGVRLDRLPLRDPDHRRHGHRRRVLGHQLGDR